MHTSYCRNFLPPRCPELGPLTKIQGLPSLPTGSFSFPSTTFTFLLAINLAHNHGVVAVESNRFIFTFFIRFGRIPFAAATNKHSFRLKLLDGALQLLRLLLNIFDIFVQFVSSLTSSSRSSTLWKSLTKLPEFLLGISGEFLVLFL